MAGVPVEKHGVSTAGDSDAFADVLFMLEHDDGTHDCASCSSESAWRYTGRTVRARVLFMTTVAHSAWLIFYGAAQLSALEGEACDNGLTTEPCTRVDIAPISGICILTPPLGGTFGSCANKTNWPGVAYIKAGGSCVLTCEGGVAPDGQNGGLLQCDADGSISPPFCGAGYPRCPMGLSCKRYNQQLFYAWAVILIAFDLAYLAYDWIIHENEYASYAFVQIVFLLELRTIYVPLSGDDEFGREALFSYAHAIGTTVMLVYYVCMARYVDKQFGLTIYRVVKTNLRLRKPYSTHEICLIVLKIDVMYQGMLIITGFTFFYEGPLEKTAAVIGVVCAICTTCFGALGLHHESKQLMRANFILAGAEPAYVVGQMVYMTINADDYPNVWFKMIYGIGILCVVLRSALVWWCVKAYQNFGQGLRERRVAAQAQLQLYEQMRREDVGIGHSIVPDRRLVKTMSAREEGSP